MTSDTRKAPSNRLRWKPILQRIKRSSRIFGKKSPKPAECARPVISSPIPLSPIDKAATDSSNQKLLTTLQQDVATLAILESIATPRDSATTSSEVSRDLSGYGFIRRTMSRSTPHTSSTSTMRSSTVGSFTSRFSSEPSTPGRKNSLNPTPNFSRLSRGLSKKRPISQSYDKTRAAAPPRRGSTIQEPERPQRPRTAAYTPMHAASDLSMMARTVSTSRRIHPGSMNYERPAIVEFHRPESNVQLTLPLRPSSAAYTPVHAGSDFSKLLDQTRPIEYLAAVVTPTSPPTPFRDAMIDISEEPSSENREVASVAHFRQQHLLIDLSDSTSTHSSSSDSDVHVSDYQTFLATSRIAAARAARATNRSRSGTPITARIMDDVSANRCAVQHQRNSITPGPHRPHSRSESIMRKIGTYIKPVSTESIYSNSHHRNGSWGDDSHNTRDSTLIGSDRPASRLSGLYSAPVRISFSRNSFRPGETSLWGWEEGRRSARPQMPNSPSMKHFTRRSDLESEWWDGEEERRRGRYFGGCGGGEGDAD